LKQEPI